MSKTFFARTFAFVLLATLALALSTPLAHAHGGRGGWGHGGWGHGGGWRGGVSIGIGVGPGYWGPGYGYYGYGAPWGYRPWWPGYVVVPPAVVYGQPEPADAPPQVAPQSKGPPDPIFYPRDGQSAAQTERDLHACNRWALEQPNAVARADVFQRATLACMQGRGYTVG